MAKYMKKPVVIDAVKWNGNEVSEVTEWVNEAINIFDHKSPGWMMRINQDGAGFIHIGTLEGTMIASPGDYIIRGIKGEIYPCKPEIFELSYEAI